MLKWWTLPLGFFLLLSLVATPAVAGTIRVSAAASLAEAVSEICHQYSSEHPQVTLVRNFSASGTLAKQIASGAPVDLYISANPKWMDYLVAQGRVAQAGVWNLAGNTLVVIGRKEDSLGSLAALKNYSRIAIGSPKSVPAGGYAETALMAAGVYKQLQEEKRLVIAKDVRQALMYAERGEVDAAFVYRTDALLAQNAIILFEVPRELSSPISYPVGLTGKGTRNNQAVDFFAYLKSPDVAMILAKYGFVTAAQAAVR